MHRNLNARASPHAYKTTTLWTAWQLPRTLAALPRRHRPYSALASRAVMWQRSARPDTQRHRRTRTCQATQPHRSQPLATAHLLGRPLPDIWRLGLYLLLLHHGACPELSVCLVQLCPGANLFVFPLTRLPPRTPLTSRDLASIMSCSISSTGADRAKARVAKGPGSRVKGCQGLPPFAVSQTRFCSKWPRKTVRATRKALPRAPLSSQ